MEARGPSASETDNRVRFPLQVAVPVCTDKGNVLKPQITYTLKVNDFGRIYMIERKQEHLLTMHATLSEIDGKIPPVPAVGGIFGGRDHGAVAERKIQLEKMLKYIVRSENIIFDKSMYIFEFLELPIPATSCIRYLFKSHRLQCVSLCSRLVRQKYEKEHGYRLAHESIIKTNLHLLLYELGQNASMATSGSPKPAKSAARLVISKNKVTNGQSSKQVDASQVQKHPAASAQSAEVSVFAMLMWAIVKGGEAGQAAFLQQKGIHAMIELLFQKARVPEEEAVDKRIRSILNILIYQTGPKASEVFGNFFVNGGVHLFSAGLDVMWKKQAVTEFCCKMLWIGWSKQAQTGIIQTHAKEIQSVIIVFASSSSKLARVTAGLLFSSLLTNHLLDRPKAEVVASRIDGVLDEITAFSATVDEDANDDWRNALDTLVKPPLVCLDAILQCASAPFALASEFPDVQNPIWSGCTFAMWCLLKVRPDPQRLATLRMELPRLMQVAPERAKWVGGELLLAMHLEIPEQLDDAGLGENVSLVEMMRKERQVLNDSLRVEVDDGRLTLHAKLQENFKIVESQQALANQRRTPPRMSETLWYDSLATQLNRLNAVRKGLPSSLCAVETQGKAALTAVREGLNLDCAACEPSQADELELTMKLDRMRDIELIYLKKKQELATCRGALHVKAKMVEDATEAMETANQAIKEIQSRVNAIGAKIADKNQDASAKKALSTVDFSAQQKQMQEQLRYIDKQQDNLRDKAARTKAGLSRKACAEADLQKAAQVMQSLKANSVNLKTKSASLQNELEKMADPTNFQREAAALDEEAQRMTVELEATRLGSLELETSLVEARGMWEEAKGAHQSVQVAAELVERECSDLKSQLDTVWISARSLWTKRLRSWKDQVTLFSSAQAGKRQLADAVDRGWRELSTEKEARKVALQAVQELQVRLAALAQELVSVDDKVLDANVKNNSGT